MRYRYPSIKTLMRLSTRHGTPITPGEAVAIREACQKRRGLAIANWILDGFGVENIGLPDGCFNNCQTPDVDIQYVNMGDTYELTLMIVNGQYRVGSWGDVVEQYERSHT